MQTPPSDSEPITSCHNPILLIILSIDIAVCLIITLVYRFKLKPKLSYAYKIVIMVFMNEMLVSIGMILPLISEYLFSIGLVIVTCFQIAANFWTCVIARTVYKQTVQPGKFVKTWNYMAQNFLYAYIPSLAFSVPVAIILFFIRDQKSCLINPDDSISWILLYLLAFIIPNLLATVFNIVFLVLYLRTDYTEINRFMLFPFIQVVFGLFYLSFRVVVWITDDVMEFGDWVYNVKPMVEILGFVAMVVGRFTRDRSEETHTLITERKNTLERSQGTLERSQPPEDFSA